MEKYFATKDSIYLRYSEDYVENPKAVVIIVHGFAEHLNRYDYLTKRFNDRGISIFRYDARGHGLSSGKRGHMNSYNDMVDDLYEIVEFVKKKNQNIKIFTLGHSMGGNISGNFGIKFPNLLDGQLFSGPGFGYIQEAKGFKKNFLKVAGKTLKKTYIKNDVADKVSHDKAIVERYNNDPLVLKKATIGFFYEFIVKASENIYKKTNEYYYPCFIGHGGDDRIVSKEASKRFYNEISSKDKTLKIYSSLYHEIFNEFTKDKIISDYIKWIENKI